jgi:uncharacterized protein (DUF58 family)
MSVLTRQLSKRDGGTGVFPPGLDTTPIASQPGIRYAKPIRRESRLTFGGAIYITVTVFIAIGAINSQNNLLFWLFGVAIATLIVSGVFSGNALMKVRLEAQAVQDGFAGEELRLHYLVSNRSKFFPLFAAVISEIPNEKHPGGEFNPAGVLHLGPGQRYRVAGSLMPKLRGRYALHQIRLSTRFPFGLLQKSLIFESHRPLMILPYKLEIKPELVRVQRGRGDEIRKRTQASGLSTEFWGLREYTPGDPKRSIAWKQSARHQRLVVIEHAQPIATRLWVWLSISPQMLASDPIAVERSIALGASLLVRSSMRSVPVGLWAPALGLRIKPGVGRAHMMRCLRAFGMIDLKSDLAHDIAPSSTNTDEVLVVQSDPHPPVGPRTVRVLCENTPAQWMIDPDALPSVLRSNAEASK